MERGGSSNSQPKTRVSRSGVEKSNMNCGQQGLNRNPDHNMPIASLTRIMRRVLPATAKVDDDAKEAIQECVSEFISFITREANERCHREYRRTITPNDVISTMAALGFHNYVDPLTIFLNKHRAQEYHYPPRAVVQQPPPPPLATVVGYVPSPPPRTMDGGDYMPELPQVRDYFMDYRGGGEGSSGDMDFDPFD